MLIWRGWGIVVVGIALLAMLVGGLVAGLLRLDREASLIVATAFLIPAGIATWYVGKRMNRNADRELVDPKTGQTILVRNAHDFFFVRVEWWGPIMVVIAVVLVVILLISPPTR